MVNGKSAGIATTEAAQLLLACVEPPRSRIDLRPSVADRHTINRSLRVWKLSQSFFEVDVSSFRLPAETQKCQPATRVVINKLKLKAIMIRILSKADRGHNGFRSAANSTALIQTEAETDAVDA